MKVTIPAKETELCDCCQRDGYLQTCKACAGRYCLLCDALIPGCVHKLDVCKKCAHTTEVEAIAKKYVPRLVRVLKARDEELAALGWGAERVADGNGESQSGACSPTRVINEPESGK